MRQVHMCFVLLLGEKKVFYEYKEKWTALIDLYRDTIKNIKTNLVLFLYFEVIYINLY